MLYDRFIDRDQDPVEWIGPISSILFNRLVRPPYVGILRLNKKHRRPLPIYSNTGQGRLASWLFIELNFSIAPSNSLKIRNLSLNALCGQNMMWVQIEDGWI